MEGWGLPLTNSSARLGTELSLKDGHSRIDNTHAIARHDATDNELGAAIRRRLQDGTDNHDPGSDGNGPTTTQFLSEDGRT